MKAQTKLDLKNSLIIIRDFIDRADMHQDLIDQMGGLIDGIDEWDEIHYEDINDVQNEVIRLARRTGFCVFYPYTAAQGKLTYNAAIQHINSLDKEKIKK